MARKFTSISIETTLSAAISSTATSISVASASDLIGDIGSLGASDQFAVAIDPDTVSEEIVYVTAFNTSTNTLTATRGQDGTTNINHNAGATVKHVLVGSDLNYFQTGITNAITASSTSTLTNKDLTSVTNTFPTSIVTTTGSQTLTNKTIALGSNTVSGTIAQFNTALTDGDFATLAGTETLTNKTLTSPVITSPEEKTTVSATAATGTINFDVLTQGVLFYTTNASANFTLNFRGSSGSTLSSILATGDSVSAVFLNTNGSTAYYPTTFQIDGSSVTPKWAGGSAPAAGSASAIDAYSFTIIKTAATPTYTVLAGAVKFA